MKTIIALMAFLTLVVFTGAVQAVTVDFSVLGADSVNITTAANPAGLTLNGITFRYDDLGSGVDTAQVDAAGIFGSTFGSLIFDFNTPATGLRLGFALLGATASIDDALFITFKSGGVDLGDLLVPAVFTPFNPNDHTQGGDALGTLAFNGAAFDQAVMFFSVDAPLFSVDNLSYDAVPEPGSLVALAVGLVGLSGCRRFGRKS